MGITVAGVTDVQGTNNSELKYPWGLALRYDYTLYIADGYNNRIQKYPLGSSIGTTVAGQANGTSSSANDSFKNVATIILNSDDSLYIADTENFRVQLWANRANSGVTVAGSGMTSIHSIFTHT
jgi:hypothetical protein